MCNFETKFYYVTSTRDEPVFYIKFDQKDPQAKDS